jgi:uncharacterized integral membrane protein
VFDFIFDLPLALLGSAIIGLLCIFALVGRAVFCRHVLSRLKHEPDDSAFTGNMMQAVMVFYGLAVALIAVSVWQTYADTARIVSEEATAIGILYRDVSTYPEPARSKLQRHLRVYLEYIIHEAWPLQRRGGIPAGGVEQVNRFETELAAFEPASEGQKIVHGETFRAYNHMVEARRLRLDSVLTGLPGVLWWLIAIGAIASVTSTFFFRVSGVLHALQTVLLAALVGLIIIMILALDRPFRGDLGLPPDSYQLIYDQLMKL